MSTATLTSKGQVTVPQAVRESLGLHAGDKVDFVPDAAGGFRVVPLRKDVRALRGRFAGRAGGPVAIEDMTKAVLDEASAQARPAARPRARTVRRTR